MKMNKMFDQFMPTKFLSLPLSLMGGIMAMSWLLFIKKNYWTTNRINLMKIILKKAIYNLLPKNNKIQKSWSPWMFSIFLLCLSYKLLSLIPYTFSQTSHLSMTFSLSWPMWLSFQILGITKNWKAKISHLVPQGTPMFLIPMMVLMETLSLLMQPLTLGFRLGANLLAGHLLMFLCSCVIWKIMSKNLLGMFSFTLLMLLFMLEMAVACMQAGVFLMLSKNYLEEKLK